jgi:hypothetical protein
VIVLTLTTFGFGVYGVLNIQLNYDSIWYMDQKSYQTKYYKTLQQVFPENGERVEVYVGKKQLFIVPPFLCCMLSFYKIVQKIYSLQFSAIQCNPV